MKLSYWWYDHGIRSYDWGRKTIARIETCLKNHDFDEFMRLREYLNTLFVDEDGLKIIFLPDFAFCYEVPDRGSDPCCVKITNKENFDKIMEAQYECG